MKNKNIYIIVSTFYSELSKELIKGATKTIDDFKNKTDQKNLISSSKLVLNIIKVPGAFEIPGMIKKILDNKKPDLIITLGVIIKGETNHFEQISEFVFNSISKLTISSNVPIAFGIISASSYKQAEERALRSRRNKGREVAAAGLEMLKLYEKYKK